ncbi:MAG: glycosyltransferase 87 family protein [Pseudomonadota bacterium]
MTLRGVARVLAGVNLLAAAAFCAGVAVVLNAGGAARESWPADFTVFWEVARLALGGEVARAFDPALLSERVYASQAEPVAGLLYWLYPPTWLALILPLGALPFSLALTLYTAASIGLLALALRRDAAALPGGVALVIASPTVLFSITLGNTGLLLAALAAAALAAIARERAVLAGLAVAGFAVKPQFGLLWPVALAAARRGRAFAAAAGATLAFLLIATLIAGADYWPLLLEALSDRAAALRTGAEAGYVALYLTPYALCRELGLGEGAALVAQGAVSLALLAAVAAAWARARDDPAGARGAAAMALLCVAIPLALPRAYFYDAAFWLVAFVHLWRAGAAGHWTGRLALAAAWAGAPRPLAEALGLGVSALAALPAAWLLGYALWRALLAPPAGKDTGPGTRTGAAEREGMA